MTKYQFLILVLLTIFLMPQSFVTTALPPPGHSGELNTNQVLKTVNFPTPGAKLLVKPPVYGRASKHPNQPDHTLI